MCRGRTQQRRAHTAPWRFADALAGAFDAFAGAQAMPIKTLIKSRVCSFRMLLSSDLRGSTRSHSESRGRLRGRE